MILALEQVSKTYRAGARQVAALSDVSMSLDEGDFVAVRGPSGCGKSTLLLAAGTLLRPDAGTLTIDGENPYAMPPEKRASFRASKVGFVFQQFHLVPYLSVRDNVLAAALAATDTAPCDTQRRADELIEQFHITARADHVPAELSTGERQRVALSRALFNKPRMLLADEPTGNLDPENAAIVLDALAAFAAQGGAVLLVTHDSAAAARADRTLLLDAGRTV